MITRRSQWRDGVKTSGMSQKAKHAAVTIADWWRKDAMLVWFDMATLAEEMSVSRRTAQYAVRELETTGWLTVVEKARQHRSPRYAPTLPRGADSARLEESRGADSAPLSEPGVQISTPRGADSAPDTKASTQTTTTNLGDLAVADELVVVVVESLPEHLATSITRRQLRRRCTRLATIGWTAERFRPVAEARSWSGVQHAGAVMTWLADLAPPAEPVEKSRGPGCDACSGGWLGEDDAGRPRPCPTCRPSSGRVSA